MLKNLYTFQSSIYNSRDTRNVGHTRVLARILFSLSLSPPFTHIHAFFSFILSLSIKKWNFRHATLLYPTTNLTLFLFCLILIRERSRIYNYLHYIRVTSHTWKRYVCIYMYFYFYLALISPFLVSHCIFSRHIFCTPIQIGYASSWCNREKCNRQIYSGRHTRSRDTSIAM